MVSEFLLDTVGRLAIPEDQYAGMNTPQYVKYSSMEKTTTVIGLASMS